MVIDETRAPLASRGHCACAHEHDVGGARRSRDSGRLPSVGADPGRRTGQRGPRGIAEVGQAIKSFEKHDFGRCIEQLTRAHRGHPELPPPHALFAKLAFTSKQGSLIRPALERAVSEDPDVPIANPKFEKVRRCGTATNELG